MVEKGFDQALAEAAQWMDIEGVVGIGQGKTDKQDCIVVFISVKTPEVQKVIPIEHGGYPVRIEEVGIIDAEKD